MDSSANDLQINSLALVFCRNSESDCHCVDFSPKRKRQALLVTSATLKVQVPVRSHQEAWPLYKGLDVRKGAMPSEAQENCLFTRFAG
jgi:ethanolamine utilization protein EutP (predicted NTPase)